MEFCETSFFTIYLVDVYTKGDQTDIPAAAKEKLACYAAILKGGSNHEER